MREFLKKMFVVMVICCVVLCGCVRTGKSSEKEQPKNETGKKIGITLAAESPYLSKVAESIKGTAEQKGLEIELQYADWNIETQTQQIDQYIQEDVGAIIMAPVHSKSMLTSLKKAEKAGIPVINVNMKVDSVSTEYIAAYVGSDSIEQGKKAAEIMIEILGEDGGKVGIVEGTPGSDPQIYRTQGFLDALVLYDQITIVGIGNGAWDREKAKLVTRDLLRKNPDLKGIYCHDSEMALGVIEVLESFGIMNQVKVVGISENEKCMKMVQDGKLAGIVTQPAEYEGEYSVYCAMWAMEGEALRPWYKDPAQCLTKENIDSYEKTWQKY